MSLTWNSKEIVNLYTHYCKAIKDCPQNEQYLYELCCSAYSEMLLSCRVKTVPTILITKNAFKESITKSDDCETSKKIKPFTKIEMFRSDLEYFKNYLTYLPKDIRETLISTFNIIDNNFTTEVVGKDFKFKKCDIPNTYLIRQSYNFFTAINPSFKEVLDMIYEKHLMQVITQSEYKTTKIGNVSYIDYLLGLGYGVVVNEKNCEIVNTYNHELAHMIDGIINSKQIIQNSLYYLTESRSIFASYLTDYQRIGNDENLKSFYNYFKFIKECIYTMSIMYKLSNKVDLNEEDIKRILKNYGVSKKSEQGFYRFPPYEAYDSIMYVYSSIIALHMLYTYEQDPEKAFFYYNRSLDYKKTNALESLKNIDFDYRDYDYAKYLLNSCNDFLNNKIRKRNIKND